MNNEIVLITSDNIRVTVPYAFSGISGLVKNVISDFEGEIKLTVPKNYLDVILEYAEHHGYEVQLIDKPLKSNKIREVVKDPWDFEFLMRVKRTLDVIDLILHVNYMDVGGLMELLFAFIACKFKGKDINMIRTKFKISDEFTEEEERKLIRENPWAPK